MKDNIVNRIAQHASSDASKPAISYHSLNGEIETITYGELHTRIQTSASQLLKHHHPGDRVILVLKPTANYVCAFLGCLAAGIIPVPCYLPFNDQLLERLVKIMKDCQTHTVILDNDAYAFYRFQQMHHKIKEISPVRLGLGDLVDRRLNAVPIKFNETLLKSSFYNVSQLVHGHPPSDPLPDIDNEVAFLQYTSGTTGNVKGVCVSHANIVSNLETIKREFKSTDDDRGFIWLPPYHDMGLIGGLLETLYVGMHSAFLSPLDFIKSPISWLTGVAKHGATISGGPNFAYELCNNINESHIPEDLDLSTWRVAFCGAEPINAATLENFSKKYAPYGFRSDAFFPCYGLAESTLYVVGQHGTVDDFVLHVDQSEIANNRLIEVKEDHPQATRLISSGESNAYAGVRIIDADDHTPLDEGQIGRILVSGEAVTMGYWQNADANAETFVNLDEGGEWIRYVDTGDCGALVNNHLYVLGRYKDLVIINGKNYYVSYLEYDISNQHPSIRKGCVAAIQPYENEDVVLLVETRPNQSPEDKAAITQCVENYLAENSEFTAAQILLVPPRTIPKTSSGKISRVKCKDMVVSGQLSIYQSNDLDNETTGELPLDKASIEKYTDFIHQQVKSLLKTDTIDTRRNLIDLGLDSLNLIALCHAANHYLGKELLSVPELYNCDSMEEVIRLTCRKAQGEEPVLAGSELDEYIQKQLATDILPIGDSKDTAQNYLLTGTTGFVGIHILDALLKDTNAHIYCLIRAQDMNHARERLHMTAQEFGLNMVDQLSDRMTLVIGDCQNYLLGMHEHDYEMLTKRIDRVIHAAAEVNFLKNAHNLYRPNVLGTENILRFACTDRQKTVDYISTYSVTLSDKNGIENELREIAHQPEIGLGYTKTKWLAELLCYQAMERDIPVNIYRLGHIGGSSKRGFYNKNDLLTNVLISCFITGNFIQADTRINFSPVDYISRDVVELAQKDQHGQIYNLISDNGISINELRWMSHLLLKFSKVHIKSYGVETWIEEMDKLSHEAVETPCDRFMPLFKSDHRESSLINQLLKHDPKRYKAPKEIKHLSSLNISKAKYAQLLYLYLRRYKALA